jgi:A/G-specific adenine glycosylase
MNPASPPGIFRDSALTDFQGALLHWYDRNRRDLPWRRTRDPYRIWISEIMLQQTRVAAVLEHYGLFLKRFPNVRVLAAATESSVLAAWSGLGYYRRARMLRECAQKIVAQHRGRFPRSSETLQTLPGIGRYTAAAIASIAFSEQVAVLDGNVERVLQRLAGRSLTSKDLWRGAQSLLSQSRPADFNQAMMELGAMVCTPRQPKCDACPIRTCCATQGEAPRITPRQRQARKEIWCLLDQRNGDIRLVKRPASSSLMAAMWELPQASPTVSVSDESEKKAAKSLAKTANQRKIATHSISRGSETPNGRVPKERKNSAWRTFRHSITVTDYTVHVIRAAVPRTKGAWIPIADLSNVPITGLTRKILKAARII